MSRPTRRDALRSATLVGLWAGLGTVGGCGVRLEDDAPDVPFLPRRTPVPAEAELLALLAALRGSGGAVAAVRADALARALVADGVPGSVVADASATAGRATATGRALTASTGASARVVASVRAAELADSPAALERALGRTPRAVPGLGRTIAAALEATRDAQLVADVAAARVAGPIPTGGRAADAPARRPYLALRDELAALAAREEAALPGDADPEPLGGRPATEIDGPETARTATRTALERALSTHGRLLVSIEPARAGRHREEVAAWLATLEAARVRFGGRPSALPGLATG